MFLKVMSEDERCGYEVFYECKRIRLKRRKEFLLFILEDEIDNVTRVVIEGEDEQQIYIMNHEGKTIERIVWNSRKSDGKSDSKDKLIGKKK